MEHGIGDIVEGRVTGITKFGAFVTFDENRSGLVHISEVANTFVKDVSEHLTVGQTVNVKIIAIDESGRISLSIKKALPVEPRPFTTPRNPVSNRPAPVPQTPEEAFEDKLKAFMVDSQSRMSDIKHQSDRKSGSSRPRRNRP